MRNKRKKIYIMLLFCASLCIAVLYSPIGSPDLYRTVNYYEQYHVDTKVNSLQPGIAVNMKQINQGSNSGVKSLSTIQGSAPVKNNNAYAASNSQNTTPEYTGSVTGNTKQNITSSKSGAFNEGSGQYPVASLNKKSSNDKFAVNNVFGSKDISSFESNNSLQGVDYTPGSGGTDPGGEENLGPPIPVPDGFGLLLVMALIYIVFKRIKFN